MDLKKEERYYQPLVLHRWFGISSLLFLGSLVAMFGDDYIRDWKAYQRDFRRLDAEQTKVSLDQVVVDAAQKERLEARQAEAEANLVKRQSELDDLAARIEAAEGELYWATMRYEGGVAEIGALRYQLEHALSEGESARGQQKRFDAQTVLVRTYRLETESSQAIVDDLKAQLADVEAERTEVKRELSDLFKEVAKYERKLSIIDPESMTTGNRIANIVRDLPIIDFLAPSIKIQQLIINDVRDNVNFAVVPKVDRCTTCHLGIDKTGFEDAPQPFTTHPKLELYLKSSTPHPINEFGCTSCHAGRGRGTSFTTAAHMPATLDQRHEWEEKYGWEPMNFWEEKINPAQYSEAGCLKCHAAEPTIRGAEKLTLGLAIMEKAACYGCHELARFKGWDRRGPNLASVTTKLDSDFMFKWIRNPRSFRHNTWMPSFFNQTNSSSAEDVRRTDTEIHAIIGYLEANSEGLSLPRNRIRSGNAGRGKTLFESVGCLGCHVVEPEPSLLETDLDRMFQRHGPNLVGVGSKTSAAWVFNWIKDPTFYNPNSRMPDLRLTDREAGDITAYLMGLTNENFADMPVPSLDQAELENIAVRWLAKNAAEQDARKQVAEMSQADLLAFVGRRSILHYGCFSCHNIPGFEDAKPIGTPLTFEGSKPTHNLDFASVHEIGHTNYNWFEAKLTNPRIFDRDKVKPYDEKLRMPNFYFTETEVEAVTTALMGLVKSNVHPDMLGDGKMKHLIVNRGMTIIKDYNCQGCHIINGQGGQIVEIIGDPALSPPNLNSEGAKVQTGWLYNFFKAPSTIRPNLTVRMPTYSLTDEQWSNIILTFQFMDGGITTFETPHTIAANSGSLPAGRFLASKDMGDCAKCHMLDGKEPSGNTADWAPDFALAKERLRPDWLIEWMRDPQVIMPGTRMPQPYIPSREDVSFDGAEDYFPRELIRMAGDNEALLGALRDYVYSVGQ